MLHANNARAAGASAYMLHQFEFYGIITVQRRKLCIEFMKKYPLHDFAAVKEIVEYAWSLRQREWQYFAMEFLMHYHKLWNVLAIECIEYCIIHKSWWDTVDYIADALAGKYFTMFPEDVKQITARWNNAEDMWLQRSSLLFQKKYKSNVDKTLLAKYIINLAPSREFFIRKAIGWILREYAKTNAAWVRNFVQKHEQNLSSLSKREALKHLI